MDCYLLQILPMGNIDKLTYLCNSFGLKHVGSNYRSIHVEFYDTHCYLLWMLKHIVLCSIKEDVIKHRESL